jgi:hypothetical protein
MYVTENPNRYLINLSHNEMAALRKLLNAGFLVLEGDGLWASFTIAERKAVSRWLRRDPTQPTGPRQPPKKSNPFTRRINGLYQNRT